MKNRWKKLMIVLGTAGVMSLAVYGCSGGTAQETGQEEMSGTEARATSEDRTEARATSEGRTEEQTTSEDGTEDVQQEDSSDGEKNVPEEAADIEELMGDIQRIGEGQFVVAEIYQETMDDGSELMVVDASGNEENMNLITVVYDDSTVFFKRTIRNGGADYEDSEAAADDLEEGLTAEMEGSYEGEIFHASRIKLIEVIL